MSEVRRGRRLLVMHHFTSSLLILIVYLSLTNSIFAEKVLPTTSKSTYSTSINSISQISTGAEKVKLFLNEGFTDETSSSSSSSSGLSLSSIPYYEGWTYILALGIIVAFIDGFGIGANDVANSFATSVGSGSLTLFQAVCIGMITEATGAILLGKNTSETIRGKIIQVSLFNDNPSLLMLGMFSALVGSASFVLTATRFGLPVSTTHSIIGSICGVGIAAFGVDGVSWNGITLIIASWFISPALAGVFGILIWKSTEYLVLRRDNSYESALKYIPCYVFITVTFVSFFMVYKGISRIDVSDLIGTGGAVGVSFGLGATVAILSYFFYIPYVRKHVDTLVKAQLDALNQPTNQPAEHDTDIETDGRTNIVHESRSNVLLLSNSSQSSSPRSDYGTLVDENSTSNNHSSNSKVEKPSSQQQLLSNKYLNSIKSSFFSGVRVDVVNHTDLALMHARAVKYERKTEIVYSALQILTAAFASFAHGSNDIANAVGPLSTIWTIYSSKYQDTIHSTTDTPIWIILICVTGLDLGLFLYGYNIMRELGNKITYHSPARGFSMELAAGFAVLFASKMGWPISTTQCITGATFAVGLSSGDIEAVNWRRSIVYMSAWMVTLPVAGLISGLLFSLIAFAPKGYVTSTAG